MALRQQSPGGGAGDGDAAGAMYAVKQASSGLYNARITRRPKPALFDTLEAVVLKRQDFEDKRQAGEQAGRAQVDVR